MIEALTAARDPRPRAESDRQEHNREKGVPYAKDQIPEARYLIRRNGFAA
jgi:hypothetical protein